MADTGRMAPAFCSNRNYVASSSIPQHLRVWETTTQNRIADFSIAVRQQATCSCLQWGPGRHLQTPQPPRKKKKGKPGREESSLHFERIAVGTTDGTILLYSVPQGDVHTVLEKGHVNAVTDICWHPDGVTMYSSSMDGYVVEWDLTSAQLRRRWKASSEGVHSMCLSSQSHLLTAGRGIKKWDLKTQKVVQKFKGHSTQVLKLLPVVRSSTNEDGDDPNGACSYFLSAACDDRLISAWYCHPDSTEKHAITSFTVPEEPVDMTMKVLKDQKLTVAVLTKGGKAVIFEHTLNGKLEKPLKPKMIVHAASKKGRGKVPVPILGAQLKEGKVPGLLVMVGSALQPKFETVALNPMQPELELLVDIPVNAVDESTRVKTTNGTSSTSMAPGLPASEESSKGSDKKRKRKQSASEPTIEEKLQAMELKKSAPPPTKMAKIPKCEQLVTQLKLGLESGDTELLTSVFQEQNEGSINRAVKNLPQRFIQPLTEEIHQRMEGHPENGLMVIKWMKQVLRAHMSYLVSIPTMMETLQKMQQRIEDHRQKLSQRTVVQGRLQLLLSRIAAQSSDEEEAGASTEPALLYQDDSSDADMGLDMDATVEFGASESEDNWDEWD